MPYNPGVEYRGDKYLFQGIAGAGEALAQGVQKWRANKEESQFLDTRAETMAKLLGPLAASGAEGVDPKVIEELAQFPGLSLNQKRGKLAGLEFLLDQTQRQAQAQAVQRRHEEEMGLRRAGVELQRGQLLASEARQQREATTQARRDQDTLGMLLGLSGQSELPAPVNREAPGPYLQQQYPMADPRVIDSLIRDNSPAAKARLAIDQGNLDVARDQVANRREQVLNESQRVDRKVLTPSALASLQNTKSTLRVSLLGAKTEEDRAAIQEDIDQIDRVLADGLPPRAGAEAPAVRKFNPKTGKLE